MKVVPIGKPEVEPNAAASAPASKLAMLTDCVPDATVVGDEQAEEVHNSTFFIVTSYLSATPDTAYDLKEINNNINEYRINFIILI